MSLLVMHQTKTISDQFAGGLVMTRVVHLPLPKYNFANISFTQFAPSCLRPEISPCPREFLVCLIFILNSSPQLTWTSDLEHMTTLQIAQEESVNP
jgi:glucose-6-phosphate-specific signal transduction histidine kinase